jgi:molybdopterin converting factor subunit 1
MRVRVRLFAGLREAFERPTLELELPAGSRVEEAWQALLGERPELAPYRGRLAVAVNRAYVAFDAALVEGDEVAFIPPVAGG